MPCSFRRKLCVFALLRHPTANFFIDRCHAFYKTPACDHEIPQQNAERTFELLLHGTPYADCLIAEDENGQPCAYCLLALTWSNEAGGLCVWLEEIMVDDERRGKGIGSRHHRRGARKIQHSRAVSSGGNGKQRAGKCPLSHARL